MAIVTFDNLRQANIHRNLEWGEGAAFGTLFHAVSLGGEVGEALNVVKKLERERMGLRGTRSTLFALEQELADSAICVDLVAMSEHIDMDRAIMDKFNLTSINQGLSTRLNLKGAR
jgi:NTP pyrophosphatase (non-canonical NTP hydrolase)